MVSYMKKMNLAVLAVAVAMGLGLSGCSDSDSNDAEVVVPPTVVEGENIQLNEVYTWGNQDSKESLDWIELYNPNDTDVDITGYKMYESAGIEEVWTFPSNSIIPAKSVYVIETDKYEHYMDVTNHPIWGLSKGPDETMTLLLPDGIIIDEIAIPSLKETECYGRETNGADDWVIFSVCTQGEANTGELRQPVTNDIGLYINEVFTNGQDDDDLNTTWDETLDFVELYNNSDTDINLCSGAGYTMIDDAKNPGYEFEFSKSNSCLVPANGFLVIQVSPEKWKDDAEYGAKPTEYFVFGLGKSGDWVFIKDESGTLVAEIEVPGLPDIEDENGETVEFVRSYGRLTDASEELTWFATGGISPNESNDGKETGNTFPEG